MQLELFANGAKPTHCNYCLQPFFPGVQLFHSKVSGRYFCDVFCAQDELDAQRIRADKLKARMM